MYDVRIPNIILNQLNFSERGIYTAIREYMNWNDYTCYPSISTLAEKLQCSQNTVRKYLKQIEKKGIITIERRKRISRKGTKFNLSNLYTFVKEKTMGVLQIKNKGTSKDADKQELINNIDKNKNMTLDSIKTKLLKKYSNTVIEKALKCLKRATKKGTVVNHLYSYLNAICSKILKQMKLTKDVVTDTIVSNKKSKSPTARDSRTSKKTKFHNFEQRTSKYTAQELEDKVRFKFNK
ncbi:MAG: HTH domain-containing protein [Firmicutes bacterium]|nr:HTH domain-containing protein [Bacillota bacterium]